MLLVGVPYHPPPPTSTVREHRAAAGHAERAHEGADGEPRAV
jgi:hypothetical protein